MMKMPSTELLRTQDTIAKLLGELSDLDLWRAANVLLVTLDTGGDLAKMRECLSNLPHLFPTVKR
jgi:hypothetical protein